MSKHYQIVVIGAGPGGYVAAIRAAILGAEVAIIEKSHFGGTCLNNGCIPSKALLASAELLHRIGNSKSFGVNINGSVDFDWKAIQKRKDIVIKKLRAGISNLFKVRGIDVYSGDAVLDGNGKINVTKGGGVVESVTADNVIIATGSVPMSIAGWPCDSELVCNTDEALHWDQLPKKLLIVGGGVIGCEFACMMAEYGVEVTVVEIKQSLLPEMEIELGETLRDIFIKRGIKVLTDTKVEDIKPADGFAEVRTSDGNVSEFDRVLVAAGRKANLPDGLVSVGIEVERGFVKVNDRMETSAKRYYCIGDANGRCMLAHAASAQGEVAVKNALGIETEQVRCVPSAVYTFPEIASVGMTTKEAVEKCIPVCVGRFPIAYLGKAMAAGVQEGFVKVIRHKEDDRILGVHIAGHNATEIIESSAAMLCMKASTEELADMIFAHPTISEAVKEAAEDSFFRAIHLPPRME